MVGGVQAIREPWRNTYAHLVAAQGWAQFVENFSTLDLYRYLSAKPLKTIDRMLETGLNVPLASSCGDFRCGCGSFGTVRRPRSLRRSGRDGTEALAEKWPSSPDEEPYTFAINEHDACSTSNRYPCGKHCWKILAGKLGGPDGASLPPRTRWRFATWSHTSAACVGPTRSNTVALSGCFQNKLC